MNGEGYRETDKPRHIWVVDVPQLLRQPQKARQVTSGEFDEADITWSSDGSRIYFTSYRVKEHDFEPRESNLYVVSARGGEVNEVASINGPIRKLSIRMAAELRSSVRSIATELPGAHTVNRTCS
jgi:dipeptidyl aminopeptidase/acylaminoacyl peptidase